MGQLEENEDQSSMVQVEEKEDQEKVGQLEENEDQEKVGQLEDYRQYILMMIICLAINIASIIVGDIYWHDCNLGAARYLFYAGILGISFAVFILLLVFIELWCEDYFRPSEESIFRRGITVVFLVAGLVRIIWGFVLIFPAYATWSHTEGNTTMPLQNGTYIGGIGEEGNTTSILTQEGNTTSILTPNGEIENPNYCHYTPFMFAFVSLIIESVFLSSVGLFIICCCSPLGLLCCCWLAIIHNLCEGVYSQPEFWVRK